MQTEIVIRGAREHNLKNINLNIPRNQFVVLTGLSGSGKSSLAFDTIYAEGQRRYIECLSSYARQFLERLKKPEVDFISGLSPAISIDQKHFAFNPRSTVATVTELHDYLRLLFAKLGTVHCYQCGMRLGQQSVEAISGQILAEKKGADFLLLANLVRGRKGEFGKLFQELKKKGFSKVIADGKEYALDKIQKLKKTSRHDVDLVIDHLRVDSKDEERLLTSLRAALDFSGGSVLVRFADKEMFFSEKLHCPKCDINIEELTPNMFSFNSPYGYCKSCRGLGQSWKVMSRRLIKHPEKGILSGALSEEVNFSFNRYVIEDLVARLREAYEFEVRTPFQDLPEEVKSAFFWGDDNVDGLVDELQRLFYTTDSEEIKAKVRKFLQQETCEDCGGSRLRPEVRGVRVAGKNISELSAFSVEQAHVFFRALSFTGNDSVISRPILKELSSRLKFLHDVGLTYLTLDRAVNTLSGGELQRIRLARQISVGLTGVLYVLDEPSIGLHPRDNNKLLKTLRQLCDLKNTVLVVEHDEETIRQADFLIDMGPRAGLHGGEVVGAGTVQSIEDNPRSLTGQYLTGAFRIAVPKQRKKISRELQLKISGAREHNLKNINVSVPLGLLVCVTGVSGSGKSTLVHDILFRTLHNQIWGTDYPVGKHKSIDGMQHIDKVVEITQTPIGRTSRSNPATYTDMFGIIRKLFAEVPEAKIRNYTPSRFSFNLKGGRCEQCQGEGLERLSMSFLSDLEVTCDHCQGRRYNQETLEVKYGGKSIAEILDLAIDEALLFFKAIPVLRERLQLLQQIGLGYLKLGQSSTTLSGGEAQRIKLASELGKRATGKTLYSLDEPTTGLHFADIQNLLTALFALRDQGNTVLVIEHNLDVIKTADYIIDLGPDGGEAGGKIVAAGTPEEIAAHPQSVTGHYLKSML